MIAKITLYNGVVYKIGDKTQDTSDGLYAGRIVDELQIESKMSDKGATPLSLNITIRNDDNFIPNTVDLWATTIELTATNGNKWVGKINFFDFDADGNVYVTASEKTAPELELQLPDEVRQVYTVDNNFHPSSTSMTIPLVVGGTASAPITLSTILIDKQNGVYLIGTGEIRQILKVYNGSEELPASAYTAYTGTASQSEHAGFAYVKINEAYRKNADGTYAEINVDVIGLKLSSYNAEECRNPARFLYYFLTTPSSGVNGWGCGISASDIDSASFNSAITLCDTLGYKLDGIMWLRQSAQSWIDQICQTMHASYTIGANGKRTLFIDYAGAVSKRTFTENDCKVSRYGKNSYSGQVYNKGVLSYGYNPITGLFMQSAQFEDSASVSQIGEQKFVGESYLIGDASTALKVLEYTCKRSLISAEAIEFETDRLETLLKAGDLITLNFPSRNINAVYQIANISTSEYKSSISAVKFDTSVFTVSGSKTNVAWGKDRDITPALTPAQATNLLLSTGFDINPDGTGIPYISGTFDVPAGGWIAAAVQYGVGVNPTNYTELALITEGRFKIQPVSVGTVYTVRIRMITATGHSDYISGQITSTGDSIAPAIPTIAVNATDKSVIVQCAIDNPPYDMGGFQIHRKKHSESVYTLIGNVAANRGYASFSDYVDDWVAYDYKAKSYDRSGNLSDFSEAKTVTVTGIQANDISATALRIPTGSILRLSAKGCTTDSIKSANGVKDVSGYNHHGKAYGGVSVLDGGEGFSFDGNSGYARIGSIGSRSDDSGYTVSLYANFASVATDQWLINRRTTSGNSVLDWQLIWYSGSMNWSIWDSDGNGVIPSDQKLKYDNPVANEWHQYTLTVDFETRKGVAYKDGLKVAECIFTNTPNNTECSITLGRAAWKTSYYFNGSLRDVRIYPRALSATEVKSMYMLPDEAIFGQLNADLIGANIIRASNLVMTEALITNAAQIDQAVVNNLNVSGNATFQAGLSSTLASAKTYADGKASTAQSNAEAAAAALAAVTNNIYYTGTTKIDGGVIQTGSIGAAAIAANSITADKITVNSRPAGCIQYVTLEGAKDTAVGSVVPNLVNSATFKVAGSAISIYHNDATSNGWCMTTSASKRCIQTVNSVSIPVSVTIAARWRINSSAPTTIGVMFDAAVSASSNANRLTIYVNTDRYICIDTYNSSGTKTTTVTTVRMNGGSWYNTVLCFGSGSVTIYRNGSPTGTTVTIPVREDLTAGITSWGNKVSPTSDSELAGYLGYMQIFGRTLSNTEAAYISKVMAISESGLITADRIATSAIKSRNYQQGGSGTATSENGLAFSAQGSFLNLDGGSYAAPKFRIGNDGSCHIGSFRVNNDGSIEATGIAPTSGDSIFKISSSNVNFMTYFSMYGGLTCLANPNHEGNYSAYQTKLTSDLGRTVIEADLWTISGEGTSAAKGWMWFNVGNDGSSVQFSPFQFQQQAGNTRYCMKVTGKISMNGADISSDKTLKKDFKDISVLNSLKRMSVQSWRFDESKMTEKENAAIDADNIRIDAENAEIDEYNKSHEEKRRKRKHKERLKANKSVCNPRQIGCMAQDFNEAFGTNPNAKDYLNVTDALGVSMRAIQELAERNDDLIREVRQLKRILRANGTITDEIIAEDRDNEAIRRLEIAKARQAKREARLLANNSEIENAVIEPMAEDEILANNSDDEPTEPQLDDEPITADEQTSEPTD